MNVEYVPASRIRIEQVREAGFHASAEIHERQWSNRRIEILGKPLRVLRSLALDADQRDAFPLRLQSPNRLPVDEQQVVGEPVALRHLELADGDTAPRGEVDLVAVLDLPARHFEVGVNALASFCFRAFWRRHREPPGGSGIAAIESRILPSRRYRAQVPRAALSTANGWLAFGWRSAVPRRRARLALLSCSWTSALARGWENGERE